MKKLYVASRLIIALALIAITSLFVMQSAIAEEDDDEDGGVKLAVDLKAAGDQAKQRNIPLMIFFAAEDCEFCERLEGDYLYAMSISGEYKKRVLIRKVVIDSYDMFRDFNGKVVEASDFSDDYNIQVTPTLVFTDHRGNRLSRRIIGYNASGFFGAELDEAINMAIKHVR